MTPKELSYAFRTICLCYYTKRYPYDDNILLDSISIGKIYDNPKSINCQIRFLNNGHMFHCSYIKETEEILIDVYKINDVIHAGIFEDDSVGIYNNNQSVDEIMMERKSNNKGHNPNYQIKTKRKMLKQRSKLNDNKTTVY